MNSRVLIVEDEPKLREVLVDCFQSKGEEPFEAANGNDSEPLTEEELKQVWDKFYRVEESRSTKGTGLGLAIAKSIIELHGGKCYVKNTKNGVEFGFVI